MPKPLMETSHSKSDAYERFVMFLNIQVVYMLHYLVDILKITSSLCLEFQEHFVDVITIEVLVMGAIRDI